MKFVDWRTKEGMPSMSGWRTERTPLDDTSDEVLLRRLADGDAAALSDLFDRYHQPLYRFLRRQCGDATFAEDLVQETFLRLMQAQPATRGVRHAKAYLYRIGLHLVHDAGRRRQLEARHEMETLTLTARPGTGIADQVAERDALDTAMAALSPKLRNAVALHYFADLSINEIAQILRVPEGTVKSRLGRAYRQLADWFEGGMA